MPALATLVLGVGGTGLTVLQHVKERLIETYAGAVPAHVGLLAFDTTPAPPETTGGVALATEAWQDSQDAPLRPAEFLLLSLPAGWNLRDVLRDAQNGADRWAWLEADKLAAQLPLEGLGCNAPPNAWRLNGRLLLQLNYPQVKRVLEEALHHLHQTRDYVHQHTRRNIFLVGSLVGGTGGGLVLDMAVLLRAIMQTDQRAYQLLGMLALPGCFAQYVDVHGCWQANSYAALRELDRFMRGHSAAHPYTLPLPDGTSTQQGNMLFDLCYLVDAHDHAGALAAIADAIVTHIDARCGRDLQAAYANVQANYREGSSRRYSALNTHAVIFPREDVSQSISLRFLLEALWGHFVQPAQYTRGLAVPTTPLSIEDMLTFLSQDNPTPLDKAQAQVHTREGDLDMGVFFRTLLGFSANSKRSYPTESQSVLDWLVEDGTKRHAIQTMRDRSAQELNQPFDDKRSLPAYRLRAHGWIARYLPANDDLQPQAGLREDAWGEAFQDLPEEMCKALAARLDTLVLRLLNQRQADAAGLLRENRLGYALALLWALKARAHTFTQRTETSFSVPTRSRKDQRKKWRSADDSLTVQIASDEDAPWFGPNPGPAYLKQLDDLATIEWQSLLCQRILAVTTQLTNIIDSLISELEAWEQTFAAVRDYLKDEKERLARYRESRQKIRTRAYVTDQTHFPAASQVESQLYTACRERLWRAFLGTGDTAAMELEWRLAADAPGEYRLAMRVPGTHRAAPDAGQELEIRHDAQTLIRHWQMYTLRQVADLIHHDQQALVVGHIVSLVKNAETFVHDWLERHNTLLIRLNHDQQPDPQRIEHYLALNPTSDDPNVTRFVAWIREHWQQTNQRYIEAESEVACTFLTLYHGLDLAHVAGFVEGEAAYRELARRGEALHLFPEERQALVYEARLSTLKAPAWRHGRCLHPEIVVCLRSPQRVRAFALALVSGMIARQPTEQYQEFFLVLPGGAPLRLSDASRIDQYQRMDETDREAAGLLQAFQTFMLHGHAVGYAHAHYDTIEYDAVMPAFNRRFGTHGHPSRTDRLALAGIWETDPQVSALARLFHTPGRDPRIGDLGSVLALEVYNWASEG